MFGQTQQEHDLRLQAVLNTVSKAGVTLNPEKCLFSTGSVKFLGHVIDGIHTRYMLYNNYRHPLTLLNCEDFWHGDLS